MTPRRQIQAWRQSAQAKGALYRRMVVRHGPSSARAHAALRDVQALVAKIDAMEGWR